MMNLQFDELDRKDPSSSASSVDKDWERLFRRRRGKWQLQRLVEAQSDGNETCTKGCGVLEADGWRDDHGNMAFPDNVLRKCTGGVVAGVGWLCQC